MTTTDNTLLIILTSLLSVFFLIWIFILIAVLKLLSNIKRVIAKAGDVVDSVESAAEVFKDTQGRLAFFKLVRNIFKMANKGRK